MKYYAYLQECYKWREENGKNQECPEVQPYCPSYNSTQTELDKVDCCKEIHRGHLFTKDFTSCEEKFENKTNCENKLCYTNWRVLQNPTDPTGLPHLATNMDNFKNKSPPF